MNAHFDSYLRDYYNHTATRRALQWNAASVFRHHGCHFPQDRSAAILEIGPGTGNVLTMLQENGYTNVRAVDISTEIVDHCNRTHAGSTELVADTASYLESHTGAFDLVLMLHVLEHVPKDSTIGLIQAVRNALKPGGKLVVEVPNAGHPLVGLQNRYADFTHTVGYEDQSLLQVLRISGFSEVSVYGCKTVPQNLLRFIQRALQDGIEFVLGSLMRVYTPSQSRIRASLLGASAKK